MYSHNDFNEKHISDQFKVASKLIDPDGNSIPLFDKLFSLATYPCYEEPMKLSFRDIHEAINRSIIGSSGHVTSIDDFLEKILIGYYNLNAAYNKASDGLMITPKEMMCYVNMRATIKSYRDPLYARESVSPAPTDILLKVVDLKVVTSTKHLIKQAPTKKLTMFDRYPSAGNW